MIDDGIGSLRPIQHLAQGGPVFGLNGIMRALAESFAKKYGNQARSTPNPAPIGGNAVARLFGSKSPMDISGVAASGVKPGAASAPVADLQPTPSAYQPSAIDPASLAPSVTVPTEFAAPATMAPVNAPAPTSNPFVNPYADTMQQAMQNFGMTVTPQSVVVPSIYQAPQVMPDKLMYMQLMNNENKDPFRS